VTEWDYESMVEAAQNDDRVVGLVLTGSRGRGPYARPDSDWDVRLVVRDDALAETEPLYSTEHGAVVEAVVYSLTDFVRAGERGSEDEWDRYSYAHCEVVLDKLDGRIHGLVDGKGVLSADLAREVATRELDAYINSYYRSARNLGNGLAVEAHLDAAESISPVLTTHFALHERVRPFNKFLRWELEQHPLGDPRWTAAALLPRLEAIIGSGELAEQQALFRDLEQLARARGHGDVVDGWQPHVPWLRGDEL
jgi:predicted nucleotidyltransferase